jgi:tRNA modification GTPase
VEEDLQFITTRQVIDRLEQAIHAVAHMLRTIADRRLNPIVPQVALLGPPNAGKSTLLNRLLGRPMALVSPVAGTTRDYIQGRLPLGDRCLDLIDTAGLISSPESTPQAMAQKMTHRKQQDAELWLWCIDVSQEPGQWTVQMQEAAIHCPETVRQSAWMIGTQIDRWSSGTTDDRNPFQEQARVLGFDTVYLVSSATGEGIQVLIDGLDAWSLQQSAESANILPTTADRCLESLTQAREALEEALQHARLDSGHDLIAAELRLALDYLGTVAGEVYTDDILDALFQRFCIGK